MKILTVVGARPQFIKAAAVSHSFKENKNIDEVILHTGQHYDIGMSDIFFNELKIPKPKYNLNLGGLSHGAMTGRMLEEIEKICFKEEPEVVLVYGDTNSTIAGALAAKKLHIKVAHVEAGLRSYNMKMPEEINRILTDRISDYLFCPTDAAVLNLKNEGVEKETITVSNVGDVMYDAVKLFSEKSKRPDIELQKEFILCTIHRAENTDHPERLSSIFNAVNKISQQRQVVLPIHPRTKKIISDSNLKLSRNISFIEPVSYFEMLYLLSQASVIMSDSGGLQKEAYFMKKPCITLRDETEWIELIENGSNVLAGASTAKILESYFDLLDKDLDFSKMFYGDGYAGKKISSLLLSKKI